MKRKLTFLLAVIMLLSFLTPTQRANGQTGSTTTTFPANVYEGQVIGSATATIDSVTIASTLGYYHSEKKHVREQAGSILTITSNEAITKIELRCTSLSYANFTTDQGNLTTNHNNGFMTWTGSTYSVSFSSPSQSRWTSIIVTHGGEITPTVATPTISPEPGEYHHPIDVTIDCATEGATIYYTTNGYNPTTSSTVYTGSFPLSQYKTIKALAIKEGLLNSSIATASYTFSLPVTISTVRNGTIGQTYLTSGIVTSINSETAFIQDSTAAIMVYGSSDPVVGDEIVVRGKTKRVSGMLQLINPEIEIVSHGNTVTPAVHTIAEINENAYYTDSLQAMLVRIEEATITALASESHITTTTLQQDTNVIIVYDHIIPGAAVGKTISLTGNVGYSSTPRIVNPTDFTFPASDEPAITVTPADITLNYDGTEGTLATSYENLVPGANTNVFFCEEDGETEAEYDWVNTSFDNDMNVHFSLEINNGALRTAYFRVIAYDNESNAVYSNLVAITQTAYVYNDAATLPFHWDGNSSTSFSSITGASVNGVGTYGEQHIPYTMKLDDTGDYLQVKTKTQPGQVSIDVKMIGGGQTSYIIIQGSTDGFTYTDIETLNISGSANSTLTLQTTSSFPLSHRYVRMYYIKGSNIGIGGVTIAPADNTPAIVINEPEIDLTAVAQEGTLTVYYRNIDLTNELELQAVEANGSTPTTYDWITASLNDDHNMEYQVGTNEGNNRNAYFKIHGYDADANDIYSTLITVTQHSAEQTRTYTLVSSLNELIPGKHYIIVSKKDEDYYAIGAQVVSSNGSVGNYRTAIKVTATGNTISTYETLVHEFTLSGIGPSGFWTIYDNNPQLDAGSTGFLYASSNSNNHLHTRLHNLLSATGHWVIGIGNEGDANIIAQGENTRNTIRFNSSNFYFSCYHENNSQDDIYLYIKDNDPGYEFIKEINGYSGSTGRYYLLASPVDNLVPSSIPELLQNTYDLYAFDAHERNEEWRNYKAEPFNLVSGKGYLYAHNTDAILKLITDEVYVGAGTFELSRSNADYLAGWNLVGNPYSYVAYVDRPFYRLNNGGDQLIANINNTVGPMEGIFVLANSDGETLTFSNEFPATATQGGNISINLIQQNSVISRAIIRLDDGDMLPTLAFDENSTKLYFTQNDKDYAIVSVGRDSVHTVSTIPVNFKATENRQYTLSVNPENVEIDYLHLIDNMTGADIDLLQNPSYSFEAKTVDNSNRFMIVFDLKE